MSCHPVGAHTLCSHNAVCCLGPDPFPDVLILARDPDPCPGLRPISPPQAQRHTQQIFFLELKADGTWGWHWWTKGGSMGGSVGASPFSWWASYEPASVGQWRGEEGVVALTLLDEN